MAEGAEQADVVPPVVRATEARKQALARALEAKEKQGHRVESQSDVQAVVVTAGRRRMFGLRSHVVAGRELVSVDEQGAVTTRTLSEEQ